MERAQKRFAVPMTKKVAFALGALWILAGPPAVAQKKTEAVRSADVRADQYCYKVNAAGITIVVDSHAAGAICVNKLPAPVVLAIDPSVGNVKGGEKVTILGSNFQMGATALLGDQKCEVNAVTAETIQCTTPPAPAPAVVDVTVVNPDGQKATLAQAYTYESWEPPVLTSVYPSAGPVQGNQEVYLAGYNFRPGVQGFFGGAPCTSVTLFTDPTWGSWGYFTCKTPPATLATVVDVTAQNPDGQQSTLPHAYEYFVPQIVYAVEPGEGPAEGGTLVTVHGDGFGWWTQDSAFWSSSAYSSCDQLTVLDDHTFTCVTGGVQAWGCSQEPLDFTVSDSRFGSESRLPQAFTFEWEQAPELWALWPTAGPLRGGQQVYLWGRGFDPCAGALFGGVACTRPLVNSSRWGSYLTCQTPPAEAEGFVDVTVVNSTGLTSTLVDGYQYIAPQLVISLAPNRGPVEGGTLVTVTGENFGPWTQYAFFQGSDGYAECADIQVLDPQHFTCLTGAVQLWSQNCGGSLAAFDFYVYDTRTWDVNRLEAAFTFERPEGELFGGGTGSPEDPFIVANRQHLDNVRQCSWMHFLQTADIDLTGCNTFSPIPLLTGSYQGAGHTISNFCYANPNGWYVGLFGQTYGPVSNLTLQNFTVSGYAYVGALTGYAGGRLNDIHAQSVQIEATFAGGGIAGGLFSASEHLSVDGPPGASVGPFAMGETGPSDVSGHQRVGGIIGMLWGSLTSSNVGEGLTVRGADSVGGVVGYAGPGSVISNVTAGATVTGYWGGGAGVAGASSGAIRQSQAYGPVYGGYCTGGFVGFVDHQGVIEDNSAHGAVTAGVNVGGFAGCVWGNGSGTYLRGNVATGAVTASAGGGGFAGAAWGPGIHFDDCHAYGDVTGNGSYFYGGFIATQNFWRPNGCSEGHITNSSAHGDVTGWYYYVGGFAAASCGVIEHSYATGNVTGGTPTGGFVAANIGPRLDFSWGWWRPTPHEGTIRGSFATGTVQGWGGFSPYAGFPGGTGAFVGANWATIQDSYALGEAHGLGGGEVGGFAGVNVGELVNVYTASPAVSALDGNGSLISDAEDVHALVGTSKMFAVFESGLGWKGVTEAEALAAKAAGQTAVALAGSLSGGYYWDNGSVAPDPLATGLSDALMADMSSFTGFDFTSTWTMPSDHPKSPVPSPVLSWECNRPELGVLCGDAAHAPDITD